MSLTNTKDLCCTALLAAVLFTAAPASAFTITVDERIEFGTITDSPLTVDYFLFDVIDEALVTIDLLSRGVLAGDNPRDEFSTLDSALFLFEFNANQGFGALVASNDDSDILGRDGSISTFDSYISQTLDIGTYALAVSGFSFSEEEARSGDNSNSSIIGDSADYQLTFSGLGLPAVPLPAGLPLLLGGLGAFSFLRRKKTS